MSIINQVYYWRLFCQMRKITTIYNQYLIRNYLQKIIKSQALKLGFGRYRILQLKGVECKGPDVRGELLIKVREWLSVNGLNCYTMSVLNFSVQIMKFTQEGWPTFVVCKWLIKVLVFDNQLIRSLKVFEQRSQLWRQVSLWRQFKGQLWRAPSVGSFSEQL